MKKINILFIIAVEKKLPVGKIMGKKHKNIINITFFSLTAILLFLIRMQNIDIKNKKKLTYPKIPVPCKISMCKL